jgi:hypothetical protein
MWPRHRRCGIVLEWSVLRIMPHRGQGWCACWTSVAVGSGRRLAGAVLAGLCLPPGRARRAVLVGPGVPCRVLPCRAVPAVPGRACRACREWLPGVPGVAAGRARSGCRAVPGRADCGRPKAARRDFMINIGPWLDHCRDGMHFMRNGAPPVPLFKKRDASGREGHVSFLEKGPSWGPLVLQHGADESRLAEPIERAAPCPNCPAVRVRRCGFGGAGPVVRHRWCGTGGAAQAVRPRPCAAHA